MLLLAVNDTWSKACWVGIFQHVTILRIISGRQPHTALAARRAHCQHLYVPHTDCRGCGTVNRLMERPAAPRVSKLCSKVSQGGGCEMRGTGSDSRPEKDLSCRRHCDKSVDFTGRGIWELRRAASLEYTIRCAERRHDGIRGLQLARVFKCSWGGEGGYEQKFPATLFDETVEFVPD